MRSLFLIAVLVSLSTGVSAQNDASRSGAGATNVSVDARDKVSSLRDILSNTPDDGSVHYQLGILLMENYLDLDGAILHFDRAVDLGFQPLGSAYRLSRIYARRGQDSDAFRQLDVLSAGGFGLIGLIDDEIDYDNIRNEGRFVAIVTVSPRDVAVTLHKFQFTKLNNGAVRQYWETSTDAGESWQAIWDGKYEAIIDPEN